MSPNLIKSLFRILAPNDYYVFVNSFKYDDKKDVLDKYTIIKDNKPIREIYNGLQHFDPEMIHDEPESAGLIIKDYYANVAGDEFNPSNDEFAIQANHKR